MTRECIVCIVFASSRASVGYAMRSDYWDKRRYAMRIYHSMFQSGLTRFCPLDTILKNWAYNKLASKTGIKNIYLSLGAITWQK